MVFAGCGLNCSECPVLIATKTEDSKLRADTAEIWSSYFDKRLNPEELYCDGCKTKHGKLFGWCHECPVRLCVEKREIECCADCQAYPCKNIEQIHEINPKAKWVIENRIKKAR